MAGTSIELRKKILSSEFATKSPTERAADYQARRTRLIDVANKEKPDSCDHYEIQALTQELYIIGRLMYRGDLAALVGKFTTKLSDLRKLQTPTLDSRTVLWQREQQVDINILGDIVLDYAEEHPSEAAALARTDHSANEAS